MKAPLKNRAVSTLIVVLSVIIIVILGVLQYRWSARVSEATAVRLADSLQMSMVNWQRDFFRYFSEIGLALRIDSELDAAEDINQYGRRIAEWKSVARYPKLVSGVYLLRPNQSALRLDFASREFQPGAIPDSLETVRPLLYSTKPDSRDPIAGWRFDPEIPAMFHLVTAKQTTGWLAILLSQSEIEQRVLPDLVDSYFQGTEGLDYQVAVISSETRAATEGRGSVSLAWRGGRGLLRHPPGKAAHTLYSSDLGFGLPEPSDADGRVDIFGRVQNRLPVRVFHMPSDKGTSASVRISWFPLLEKPTANWQLVVRHRRGGALGAFVNEISRRDLAIGFGVLIVLAVNMAMLIVTSHRAQRLAQLQMNFVTAVSHELRTPLTVIISGADNICNGVVETTQQMMRYGAVIGKQARELFGLVERILLFASTREEKPHYNLSALDVKQEIESVLASTSGLIQENRIQLECSIGPGLSKVFANSTALSQCLQNLITNAVKYSGEERWLGVRARSQAAEIRIDVSDRGIGISPEDLPHIFEPFFRSPAVRDAQIHGTGLGLPLAKSIAEAMGGRIEVASKLGEGSTFTLCLRAAAAPLPLAVDEVPLRAGK
jgi:signal transduction histidine kinase